MREEIKEKLVNSRTKILENVIKVFEDQVLEVHLLGSLARRDSDYLSDIDIWLTVDNTTWNNFEEKRFEFFSKVGNVIHFCEPPQNAPMDGIFTSVFYKTDEVVNVVDFYLCPRSTSFITSESKTLFGNLDLPLSTLSLNTQQKSVPETYRIDFMICFIFGSIKRLLRNYENPLELVLIQYKNLSEKYNIQIKPLTNENQNILTLMEIISNLTEVANEKQKRTLDDIKNLIKPLYVSNTASLV